MKRTQDAPAPQTGDLFAAPGTDPQRAVLVQRLADLAEFHRIANQRVRAVRALCDSVRLAAGQGARS